MTNTASNETVAVEGRCGDNGRLCAACSLPAHELIQEPGCGGPLPPQPNEVPHD
jgi:hypothetical protein